MSYATVTELITRFGEAELIQLTDRDGGGAINQAVVAAALTDADALINGYVSARYTVPLSPVPPVITKIAADIARYTLHRDATTEVVAEAYKQGIDTLQKVSKGTFMLDTAGLDVAEIPAAQDQDSPRLIGPGRQFWGGGLNGF